MSNMGVGEAELYMLISVANTFIDYVYTAIDYE